MPFSDEAGRIVHWPPPPPATSSSSPKEGEFVQKLESNTAKTTVAKYSKFNMEEEQHHQQQQLKSQLASGKSTIIHERHKKYFLNI